MTTPELDEDDDIRARRRALAERELAFREAEIESRIKELWWTPPRMIALPWPLASQSFCSEWGLACCSIITCCTDRLRS
jgi:hypothetical protein